MGQSINLYSYDYEKLKNKIMEFCKTDNTDLVDKILLAAGSKIADRYILLNQELWDGYSCYYNIANVIDEVFNIDDSFGEIFCGINSKDCDRQELISSMDKYEIMDELNLKYSDDF